MKKLFSIIAIVAFAFNVSAQSSTPTVQWPFGSVSTSTLAATGSTTVTINNKLTIIDGATTQLTGNATIVLSVPSTIKAGAQIFLKVATTGTTTVTFSTGITCPTLTGVAGKTFCVLLLSDGTNFLPTAAPYQIN
jgi:hypothetical protein